MNDILVGGGFRAPLISILRTYFYSMPACLPACLPPACLRAGLPARRPTCLSGCLPAGLPACLPCWELAACYSTNGRSNDRSFVGAPIIYNRNGPTCTSGRRRNL